MSNTVPTIYFDESGFTGNNLLHPQQEVFTYGSVECTQEEAQKVVHQMTQKYNIQNGELKGSQLLRSTKGRRAVLEILQHFRGRIRSVAIHKKFALAGKFFEYIFEPIIASKSALFYQEGFHLFIANILYLDFYLKGKTAENIFEDFERYIRSGDYQNLSILFTDNASKKMFPPLQQILEFAQLHKDSIVKELDTLPKWSLDLTATSLVGLLSEWGQEYDQVRAICDQSKPLVHQEELFNSMVGREDRQYMQVGEERKPFTFNLSEPIILADSEDHHGIQIADVVAAATAYTFDDLNKGDYSHELREILDERLSKNCIWPNLKHINLSLPQTQLNAMLLTELHVRSLLEMDILDNINLHILHTRTVLFSDL